MGAVRPDRRQKRTHRTHRAVLEPLEVRQLLTATLDSAFTPVLATTSNPSADTISLLTHISDSNILGTVVQFDTTEGDFQVTLTDSATPATVANFLSYVKSGAYADTFFHRSVVLSTGSGATPTAPADIVQGGGYKLYGRTVKHIPTKAAVADEYTTELFGDIAGTIAMAKTSSADSATSEFYFNEHDTSSELDTPTTDSSGKTTSYTVFGKVLGDGMTVIDKLAALPTVDASKGNSALATLPVVGIPENYVSKARVHPKNLVYIQKVSIISSTSGMTFTATSDDPALVQPRVDGTSLAFTYASGKTGTANITVTGTSIDGTSVTQTFAVTVPNTSATAPVATADTATATTATATPVHVLNNDSSNAALSPSTVTVTTQPANGTATVDTATGLITYTSTAGFTGTDTFDYTVADTAGHTSAATAVTLTVVSAPVQTTIGVSGQSALRYTQPDGTVATLRVAGGSAVVTFAGPTVTTTTSGGIVTATGADATIASIVVTNASKADASLSVTTNGSSHVATIGSITDTGNLRSLVGTAVDLTGDLTVGGLGLLRVKSTDDSTLTVGSGLANPSIDVGAAANTSIVSAVAVKSITGGSFTSTDGSVDAISAPSISTLAVSGAFANSLNLTSTDLDLASARVGGALGSSWTLAGSLTNLSAKSAAAAWGVAAGSTIGTLKLGGDLTGAVSATAFSAVTIGGSITGGSITANGTFDSKASQLQRLTVGGAITNSTIMTAGNLGDVTAESMTGSKIYAGVDSSITTASGLPTAVTDLDAATTIRSVRLRAASATFSNAIIASEFIRTLSLGDVVTANGGTKQGVAAETLGALSATLDGTGKLSVGKKETKSQTTFDAYVTKQKLTLNDFSVTILPASTS